jgi:UDP-glucose 4-epimerase
VGKLLITGGTGYIGSHTVAALYGNGYEVILIDNLSNSHLHTLHHLEKITAKHIPFIQGDIRDKNLLQRVFANNKIDAVLHFAGLKSISESIEKPLEYYVNNVQGTLSLLETMQAYSVKKIIFSSSATVYGEPKYLPICENHPTSVTNPYGRTKLQVENLLYDLAHADSEWHIICLRYFNPVGAHESTLLGETPSGIPNNLVPYLAQVATGQQPELPIFGDNYDTHDGTGVRDYIHIMDVADGHVAAINCIDQFSGWHTINLGTGRGYSVYEIIKAFENITNRNIPFTIKDRRPGDVAQSYSSPHKAKQLLRWSAKRSLDDMCINMWNFQKSLVKDVSKNSP